MLARTASLLLSCVQHQEILGVDCFCQDALDQSVKRALKSFTGHSNKLGRWEKKHTGSCLVSGLFVFCAICLLFSPCSPVLLILLPGPGQDPDWSFDLVFFKTNGAWEDPFYTRHPRNSSNHGKGMALFQDIRIHPLQRVVIYLAQACFPGKQRAAFSLCGVLIKLSFSTCLAGHMSHLLSLIESSLQKLLLV